MPETSLSKKTPTAVLQSVATMTGQRDRDLLAVTLVNTLAELISSKRIAMYRIFPGVDGMEAVLVAETGSSGKGEDGGQTDVYVEISSRTDFHAVFNSGKECVQPLGKHTFMSVYPIFDQHGVAGLLEMVSDAHSEMDLHLILAFLRVYSNYLTLLDESESDTLTGLLNRRTFDNNLERIIAEYSRPDDADPSGAVRHPVRRKDVAGHPHWLAAIDIDHFKRINDKFGHLYGDEVLILIARNMQKIFRKSDKLFRFGGEEFVVVLDRTNQSSALKVLERFRSAIEHFNFPQVGKVTVSIGFVRLDKADVPSSIVGHADQALYYAKRHGRNQVCFYDELLKEGKLPAEHFSDDLQLF